MKERIEKLTAEYKKKIESCIRDIEKSFIKTISARDFDDAVGCIIYEEERKSLNCRLNDFILFISELESLLNYAGKK